MKDSGTDTWLYQIYQVVRKIVDDQQLEGGRLRLSAYAIYDSIKRSNSSLNRKPRKLLEDSIERVLEVFQGEIRGDGDSDSIDGDFEGLEDIAATPVCISVHNMCSRQLIR
jgi:ribosome biogenesis ATPase